jgi:hypothetical protein
MKIYLYEFFHNKNERINSYRVNSIEDNKMKLQRDLNANFDNFNLPLTCLFLCYKSLSGNEIKRLQKHFFKEEKLK